MHSHEAPRALPLLRNTSGQLTDASAVSITTILQDIPQNRLEDIGCRVPLHAHVAQPEPEKTARKRARPPIAI